MAGQQLPDDLFAQLRDLERRVAALERARKTPAASTTAARPAAAAAGVGATYYDTTLSKAAWSDGTVWRDAAGVVV
jgi:hypothetical protein